MKEKIIIALDVGSREKALHLVKEVRDHAAMFKVGSELYMAAGPQIVQEIVDVGGKVFLDLKFHDIPNTVTRAAVEATKLGISIMTIHAGGGRVMMRSVTEELRERFGAAKPLVVAVTVLTSMEQASLGEIGVLASLDEQVCRLALLAQDSGVDGVVCSPREIRLLRSRVRTDFRIVTPGIRLPDQPVHDQQRIATPSEALAAGADYIVIGRAITEDPDPGGVLERVLQSLG